MFYLSLLLVYDIGFILESIVLPVILGIVLIIGLIYGICVLKSEELDTTPYVEKSDELKNVSNEIKNEEEFVKEISKHNNKSFKKNKKDFGELMEYVDGGEFIGLHGEILTSLVGRALLSNFTKLSLSYRKELNDIYYSK